MMLRLPGMRSPRTLIALVWCACGGNATTPATPQPATPAPAPVAATASVEQPIKLYPPAWKRVGVGQTISFGTSVIDQSLDELRVTMTKLPASATFDPITQTVTWTPTKADMPRAEFGLQIERVASGKQEARDFSIDVVAEPQPAPVAAEQAPIIETLLLVHAPQRLEQVNRDWPLDKLLAVGAETFKLQFPADKRAQVKGSLDGAAAYKQLLAGLAETNQNPRLDPNSPQFDKAAFGDPRSWKLVAFRPRIDKAWSELRVVYQAMNSREPVFAMFRLRPVVEYVPALPRPDEERIADNKIFLGMVASRLMKDGGVNAAFASDPIAHGNAVSALMTDVMTFDQTKTKPYLHGFMIGIATEARMGGGSARNADGSYKSGDGWAWAAMKPFRTADGTAQAYVDVAIPGFWTKPVPSKDGTTWEPACAPRFNPTDASHEPGYDVLCRKTMGFVDLPAMKDGKIYQGTVDANNLYIDHKLKFSVAGFPLADGRRDLGEENGMTCSQCHIRNFGMHDYGDPANTDPSKGTPAGLNHQIPTLNFQIIPGADWQAFTLEFLQHQQCRGKRMFEQYVGPDAAKGLTCPLAK